MTSNPENQLSSNENPAAIAEQERASCVEEALAAAERTCLDQGLRFTPVRRKVLEILLADHRALGAYAILDQLRVAGFGSQPPVAYRALEFLTKNGFAHKVERLNAFVACAHPGRHHNPAFMICRKCDSVAETSATPVRQSLGIAAQASGFQIERTVLEAEGVCPACVAKADP